MKRVVSAFNSIVVLHRSLNTVKEHIYNPPPAPPLEVEGGGDYEPQVEQKKEEEQYVDDGRPWYPGRAREEFNRKLSGRAADSLNQEDDPVQVGF